MIMPLCILLTTIMPPIGSALRLFQGLLSGCDAPCFGGVVPGVTTMNRVMPTLRAHLPAIVINPIGTPTYSAFSFNIVIDGSEFHGVIAGTDAVEGVSLEPVDDFPVIDLFGDLGTPDCIVSTRYINSVTATLILQWMKQDVVVTAWLNVGADNEWSVDSRVSGISLQTVESARYCTGGRFPAQRWRGFAALWRWARVAVE
jgi:hypothetical protein